VQQHPQGGARSKLDTQEPNPLYARPKEASSYEHQLAIPVKDVSQRMLTAKGIWQSMSRKGDCLDNAVNFFGKLKCEFQSLIR